MGAKSGDQISVMSEWSGAEGESLNTILAPFVQACGVKLVTNVTRDLAVLDTNVKSTPPDVVFWPTTAPLSLYTSKLQDLTKLGVDSANYDDLWIKLGTLNGTLLAVRNTGRIANHSAANGPGANCPACT